MGAAWGVAKGSLSTHAALHPHEIRLHALALNSPPTVALTSNRASLNRPTLGSPRTCVYTCALSAITLAR